MHPSNCGTAGDGSARLREISTGLIVLRTESCYLAHPNMVESHRASNLDAYPVKVILMGAPPRVCLTLRTIARPGRRVKKCSRNPQELSALMLDHRRSLIDVTSAVTRRRLGHRLDKKTSVAPPPMRACTSGRWRFAGPKPVCRGPIHAAKGLTSPTGNASVGRAQRPRSQFATLPTPDTYRLLLPQAQRGATYLGQAVFKNLRRTSLSPTLP